MITAKQSTDTFIQCSVCRGMGHTVEQGFDGRERVGCLECDGNGGWEFYPVDAEAMETIMEIEAVYGWVQTDEDAEAATADRIASLSRQDREADLEAYLAAMAAEIEGDEEWEEAA